MFCSSAASQVSEGPCRRISCRPLFLPNELVNVNVRAKGTRNIRQVTSESVIAQGCGNDTDQGKLLVAGAFAMQVQAAQPSCMP